MDAPVACKKDGPVGVTVDKIVKAVRGLLQSGLTEAYLEKYKDMQVHVPPELVTATKQFLYDNKAFERSIDAAETIGADQC